MAEADVQLATVVKDGTPLNNLIPAGSLSKEEGVTTVAGNWQIPGVAEPIELAISGTSVVSVQKPFGNQPLMGEVEESERLFGMHVTMGGFPMKAWMTQDGGKKVLAFSNGGRWSKQ
mmetsp:Transcript_69789/g.134640  ORF Transcript_69789/g.134640 Transcript_69789/m.134640 type:complete len:117 (+) Transcript_69789:122-472(+)